MSSKRGHSHSTPSSTAERGGDFSQTPLYITVEEGRRMRIHSHSNPSSTVERGGILVDPFPHYSGGGDAIYSPTEPSRGPEGSVRDA